MSAERSIGKVVDLGRMAYQPCHDLQNLVLEAVAVQELAPTLLFVEHDPVLSLGAAYHPENLLFPTQFYGEKGIEVISTDRGGDVTFHGPRQLVAYPIFDLKPLGQDLHKWLRELEGTVIRTLETFGIEGYRFPPHTGVWVNGRKACAIGIKVRRWVSKHGIALNCDNDLNPFELIVPCGIQGYGVTSVSKEAGKEIPMEVVKPVLVQSFEEVFGMRLEPMSREELQSRLGIKPWEGQTLEAGGV